MVTKQLPKQAISTALPLFLIIIPFLVSVVLFVLAMILIELSGGPGNTQVTGFMGVLATVGDLSGALAYLIFSLIVPLGVIAGVGLFIFRLVVHRRK